MRYTCWSSGSMGSELVKFQCLELKYVWFFVFESVVDSLYHEQCMLFNAWDREGGVHDQHAVGSCSVSLYQAYKEREWWGHASADCGESESSWCTFVPLLLSSTPTSYGTHFPWSMSSWGTSANAPQTFSWTSAKVSECYKLPVPVDNTRICHGHVNAFDELFDNDLYVILSE